MQDNYQSRSALTLCVPQTVTTTPLTPSRTAPFAKDIIERSLAAALLLLCLPLLVLTALAVKLTSRGPVFFIQERGGLNQKTFRMYKFRTMTDESGRDARAPQATPGDPRMTRIGSWLRKASLDELPQLINVVRGDMALVGPRPHALAHDEYYSQHVRGYRRRFRMKPGITGWAQVHGSRGLTREISDMQLRIDYDNQYIEHWSLLLDIQILCRTIGVVFLGVNAH